MCTEGVTEVWTGRAQFTIINNKSSLVLPPRRDARRRPSRPGVCARTPVRVRTAVDDASDSVASARGINPTGRGDTACRRITAILKRRRTVFTLFCSVCHPLSRRPAQAPASSSLLPKIVQVTNLYYLTIYTTSFSTFSRVRSVRDSVRCVFFFSPLLSCVLFYSVVVEPPRPRLMKNNHVSVR